MDLDDDGHEDIVTGQYHPGIVTWFRGSEEGFLPGVALEEEGDPTANGQGLPLVDPAAFSYWIYSSPAFGDLDGDGDLDLVVGGGGGIRVNYNLGTKSAPRFGPRELLADVHGEPLMVRSHTQEEVAQQAAQDPSDPYYRELCPSGEFKTAPTLVDWDRDGHLDLLVGDSNAFANSTGVSFFRGAGNARFEPGVPLMSADTASGKWLPGDGPRVFPTDWNKDGVLDLLIGVGVPTVNNGEFCAALAWGYSHEMGVQGPGKAPGRLSAEDQKRMRKQARESEAMAKYYGPEEYWSLDYQGYVYLFLGTLDGSEAGPLAEAVPLGSAVAAAAQKADAKKQPPVSGKARSGPVAFTLEAPGVIATGAEFEISVTADMNPTWHIYAPGSDKSPMQAVELTLSLPDGIEAVGDWVFPEAKLVGGQQGWEGRGVRFTHTLRAVENAKAGSSALTCSVLFQTCDPQMCFPPTTLALEVDLSIQSGGR